MPVHVNNLLICKSFWDQHFFPREFFKGLLLDINFLQTHAAMHRGVGILKRILGEINVGADSVPY